MLCSGATPITADRRVREKSERADRGRAPRLMKTGDHQSEQEAPIQLWVGTSGYSYKAWAGSFHPERLPAKDMLAYYASRLPAVEINNTFYRLPSESTLAAWASQVPADFRFVLKASQRITHVKRLKDVGREVEHLFRVAKTLGPALGAVLFSASPDSPQGRRSSRLVPIAVALVPGRRYGVSPSDLVRRAGIDRARRTELRDLHHRNRRVGAFRDAGNGELGVRAPAPRALYFRRAGALEKQDLLGHMERSVRFLQA